MSEFSADWLQLREAADAQARAGHLLDLLSQAAAVAEPVSSDGVSRKQRFTEILDLGAGTGANLRYLAPRLGPEQRWRCIDQDTALLSQLPVLTADWARRAGHQINVGPDALRLAGPGWNGSVRTEHCDLATGLGPRALREQQAKSSTSPLAPLAVPAGGLVTASALLDLVAEDWLASLIDSCLSSGCALLFALSYDGRAAVMPESAEDQLILQLVNQHQGGDKGFGPALGPTATDVAERLLKAAGYRYWSANSDWQIGPDQPQLQQALIAGWLEAAIEIRPQARMELLDWHQARRGQSVRGGLQIQVGHRDLIALPPENG